MTSIIGTVVFPGDSFEISDLDVKENRLIVGPGLLRDGNKIVAFKVGVLRYRKENSCLWIDNAQKRYVATKGDNVIGEVTAKQGDSFRIDIGASDPASLSYLSFEGATKKNRPDVKVGDIIYGKLLVANKHMEPEMVCIDGNGKSNGMGVIRDGGNLLRVNLQWARRLMSKEFDLLQVIGEALPYEVAVGMNGKIWIKGRSVEETMVIGSLIVDGYSIAANKIRPYVRKTINSLLSNRQ